MLKKIKDNYSERYVISKLDLADSAETNRLHMLVVSPFLFLLGLMGFTILFINKPQSFQQSLTSIIYFGSFTLISIFDFIYSSFVKDIERHKAYKWKTAPFYITFYMAEGAALYNFYFLDQPFNGFLTFSLTGFIALCAFSFSPFPFLLGITICMGCMSPGIYSNFGFTGLFDAICSGILMFCLSLYKRRTEKNYIIILKKQKQNLEAKTFGNFTLFYEDKVIKFSRSKSNELMGYLIYKYGSTVNTKELITVLWGEHADSAHYGGSLRNLIVDIKHSLSELNIQNFFISEYNSFRINPESIICDYYDFLAGDQKTIQSFTGEFMSQYEWAKEVADFLSKKALQKGEQK